jgi:23S rRNA (adenine-N6)-dimethyltransferase
MQEIRFTQNFYTNIEHLKGLIKNAHFQIDDIVLDIGFGDGVITKELLNYTKKIISYEKDEKYFNKLSELSKQFPQIIINEKDFTTVELPKSPFKVFSNIPFAISSEIINKITNDNSQLLEAYLFVQKETAERYIGKPTNTQIATILNFKYRIEIIEELNHKDFNPIPNIEIVLIRIKQEKENNSNFGLYRDFIVYIFNQMNSSVLDTLKKLFTEKQVKYIREYLLKNNITKPTQISAKYYQEIFTYFLLNGDSYKSKVKGYYDKHISIHKNITKQNRTRNRYSEN